LPDQNWFEEKPGFVVFDWHPVNKMLKKRRRENGADLALNI
jgi:hypothetical protein